MDLHIGKGDLWKCRYASSIWTNRNISVEFNCSPCNWLPDSTILPSCSSIFSTHSETLLNMFDHFYRRIRHCDEFIFIQTVYVGGKSLCAIANTLGSTFNLTWTMFSDSSCRTIVTMVRILCRMALIRDIQTKLWRSLSDCGWSWNPKFWHCYFCTPNSIGSTRSRLNNRYASCSFYYDTIPIISVLFVPVMQKMVSWL